ncbi:MAG: hypothetical protein MI923_03145 [Phycisphaerales bacterium]|nr:hypothetical protein [Phycisphaerales bacterium]
MLGTAERSPYATYHAPNLDSHYKLVDLHLDSHIDRTITPEGAPDLDSSSFLRGCEDRPILGVGRIDTALNGQLLFLQRSCSRNIADSSVAEELIRKCEDAMDVKMAPDESLAEYFEIPGFVRTTVLPFSVDGKSGLASIQKLANLYRFKYSISNVQ